MSEFDEGPPKYPMLRLVVRHGNAASIALAVGVLVLMAAIATTTGSIALGIIGVVLAALAYVLTSIGKLIEVEAIERRITALEAMQREESE